LALSELAINARLLFYWYRADHWHSVWCTKVFITLCSYWQRQYSNAVV